MRIPDLDTLFDQLERRGEALIVKAEDTFQWSYPHPDGLFAVQVTWSDNTITLSSYAGHLGDPRTGDVASATPVPRGGVVVQRGIASYRVDVLHNDAFTLEDLEAEIDRSRQDTLTWRAAIADALG